MSVSLSVRHVIKYDDTDRDWVVPSSLVHEDDKGQKWLQLRSSNYGLCLLLGCSHASRNPSLKGAEGLTYVIEQRNKLLGLLPEEDKLFGGEAAPADQPKKKAAGAQQYRGRARGHPAPRGLRHDSCASCRQGD